MKQKIVKNAYYLTLEKDGYEIRFMVKKSEWSEKLILELINIMERSTDIALQNKKTSHK